jgi:hypothetical protein
LDALAAFISLTLLPCSVILASNSAAWPEAAAAGAAGAGVGAGGVAPGFHSDPVASCILPSELVALCCDLLVQAGSTVTTWIREGKPKQSNTEKDEEIRQDQSTRD